MWNVACVVAADARQFAVRRRILSCGLLVLGGGGGILNSRIPYFEWKMSRDWYSSLGSNIIYRANIDFSRRENVEEGEKLGVLCSWMRWWWGVEKKKRRKRKFNKFFDERKTPCAKCKKYRRGFAPCTFGLINFVFNFHSSALFASSFHFFHSKDCEFIEGFSLEILEISFFTSLGWLSIQ